MREMYVPGVAGLAALYALLLGLGVWAGALNRRKPPAVAASTHNQLILARREVGLFLGIFSLVATCIGASFVNGTADKIYSRGLAWCQIPIGYGFSLLFGALLFAKPMRKAEYTTMLEPFQQHYGARVSGLLFLPALWHDLFWCAAVLRALGAALGVVANIEPTIAVCVTAFLVAVYTATGGLYSVLWTSVLQLICIGAGLALASAYAALHPAVSFEIKLLAMDWLGEIKSDDLGEWIDYMLLAFFGGISCQGYYQRILSIKSASYARTLSIGSLIGFLALSVPFVMIGVIALATEWPRVDFFNMTTWFRSSNSVLPIVLKFLTPQWVSFAGLGAIAAGAMALADSCMLSIGSLFSRNVYKSTLRPKASERELDWILRISIAIVSFVSAGVALTVRSVHDLAHLGTELAYVVMFPQLLSVIHWPSLVDSYGCLAGYAASLAIRICGGESKLGIPIFVEYPFYDLRSHEQKFPFRTAAMLGSIFAQLIVSFFTRNLLGEGYLPRCCDLLGVYTAGAKNPNGVVPSSSGAALIDCTMHDASPGHLSDEGTLSSSRTDYDASSTDTQLQQCQQRYETISVLYNESKPPISGGSSAAHKANQSLQGLHNLRESMSPKTPTATISGRPGQGAHHYSQMIGSPVAPGQILGVKNLTLTPAHVGDCIQPPRIMSPTTPSIGTPYAKVPTTIITNGRLEGDKAGGDRSNMELNLNLTDSTGIVKKNIKGVKLIGMEGGTLRRPSLQGTFSPTPSVEMVNIFDRRQSSGSFGPSSLSPIPGVEACKTHGTAAHGQGGAEHCRIKRGIVRHHSFNDTGDRALTTLARQPNYPSMPLRAEECRMTLQRKDGNQQYHQQQQQHQQQKKSTISLMETGLRPDGMTTLRRDKSCRSAHHAAMTRYSSCLEGGMGHMLVSPTYSMYTSAVKSCSYFDDEAVSRF